MNRQTKRMMKRQEAADEARPRAQARPRTPATTAAGRPRRARTPIRQYVKESAGELKRVDWPTARQVRIYTTVTVVCVVLLGTIVALFDFGISELVLRIFG